MKLDEKAIEAAYERAIEVLSHDICSKEDFYSIIVAYEAARLGLRYSEECQEIIEENDGDKLYVNGTSIDDDGVWTVSGLMAFGKVRGRGEDKEKAIRSALDHGRQLEHEWLKTYADRHR